MAKQPTGEYIADGVASVVGSWKFISLQTALMALWVLGNGYLFFHFSAEPFILLNLFMIAEASLATPLILSGQDRLVTRALYEAQTGNDKGIRVIARLDSIEASITKSNDRLDHVVTLMANVTKALDLVARVTEHLENTTKSNPSQ